jgi:hypothetical protein
MGSIPTEYLYVDQRRLDAYVAEIRSSVTTFDKVPSYSVEVGLLGPKVDAEQSTHARELSTAEKPRILSDHVMGVDPTSQVFEERRLSAAKVVLPRSIYRYPPEIPDIVFWGALDGDDAAPTTYIIEGQAGEDCTPGRCSGYSGLLWVLDHLYIGGWLDDSGAANGTISLSVGRRTASRARHLQTMGTLLSQVKYLRIRRIAERPSSFKTLSLLRVENAEEVHSGFFAWLLDPPESPGCGTLFAEALMRLIGMSVDLNRPYLDRTEFAGLESIVDVLVARDFLLSIKNKVWSTKGIDQLAREYRDISRLGGSLRVPEDRMVAVFLTPAGLPPTTAAGTPW